jgi:hypothetical protein
MTEECVHPYFDLDFQYDTDISIKVYCKLCGSKWNQGIVKINAESR